MPETPRFVKVRIPERYGAVYVRGPDGREVEHKGGDVVEMPERQALALYRRHEANPGARPVSVQDEPETEVESKPKVKAKAKE